jgi:hypothetical protein
MGLGTGGQRERQQDTLKKNKKMASYTHGKQTYFVTDMGRMSGVCSITLEWREGKSPLGDTKLRSGSFFALKVGLEDLHVYHPCNNVQGM